jgi:hypothetical protein
VSPSPVALQGQMSTYHFFEKGASFVHALSGRWGLVVYSFEVAQVLLDQGPGPNINKNEW